MYRHLFVTFFIILLLPLFSTLSLAENEKIKFKEMRLGIGYAFGNLKLENSTPDYEAIPLSAQFGFNINKLFGLNGHKGDIQLAIEPYIGHISKPEHNVEFGLGLFFKYAYPLFDKISPYVEFGAGPMYLGINTYEQEENGFNFISQGGGGIQYFIAENKTINLGYRFRHISNADFKDNRNAGINTHMITAGISMFY